MMDRVMGIDIVYIHCKCLTVKGRLDIVEQIQYPNSLIRWTSGEVSSVVATLAASQWIIGSIPTAGVGYTGVYVGQLFHP